MVGVVREEKREADREQRRVVILGLEHPRAIAAISMLGERRVPVVGVDSQPSRRASASRFLKQTYRVSSNEAEALAFLVGLGERGGGVLMPTSAEQVIFVAENAEVLGRHFLLTVPPMDILAPLLDLKSCYELAGECGLRTPNVFVAHTEAELQAAVAGLDFGKHAYLLRTPPGTVPADRSTGRYTIAAGGSAEAVLANCREIYSRLGDYPTIAEAVPPAANQCIGVFLIVGTNHEAVSVNCLRRFTPGPAARSGGFVHPYDLGATAFCESIRDDEAVAAARRFARHARYFGPISVEFLRDPRDGGLVFIKADTHFIREMSLTRSVGSNPPFALYRAVTGGPHLDTGGDREGVGWLWLTNYLDTLWRQRSNPPVLRELLRLPRRMARVRALAYWNPKDSFPFLFDCGLWVKGRLLQLLRGAWSWTWRGLRGPSSRR